MLLTFSLIGVMQTLVNNISGIRVSKVSSNIIFYIFLIVCWLSETHQEYEYILFCKEHF